MFSQHCRPIGLRQDDDKIKAPKTGGNTVTVLEAIVCTANPLLHAHNINTVDQLGTAWRVTAPEQQIVDQVRAAGIDINHLNQLNATNDDYSEAVPILLRTVLDTSIPDNIRAAAASSLQRKFARDLAFDPIIGLYRETRPNIHTSVKDALANVLIAIAVREDLPKLFPLVLDTANEDNRILLLEILKKYRTHQVRAVLTQLLTDPYPHVAARAEEILKQKSFARL